MIGEAVRAALHRQYEWQDCANAMLAGGDLEPVCALDDTVRGLLGAAMDRLSLSARAYHRILRVARTIADLDGTGRVETGTSPKPSTTERWREPRKGLI